MSLTTASLRMRSSEEEPAPFLNGGDDEGDYRSLSKAAVASVVFAVLGLFSLWAAVFILLPFLGLCCGWMAWANLRRYPDELVGILPARLGLIANACLLALAIGVHSYVYATEVPDGYQRIAFRDLKPRPRESTLPYSPLASQLDGQKVFLKGYVRPGKKRTQLQQFILVGDFGQCCFGGSPKPTDVVAVNIVIDKTVDYSLRWRKIGGTFRLNPRPIAVGEDDIPGVYYQLDADYIQ